MGGHYYAYIKSFEDGKWYNFNDAIVSEIGEGSLNEKIQEMFGGNATSAYML
jgi:ubiquitin carboxyl-terminal hydrolase 47|tara:strand:- start:516 stop:671 length:156 start_codon:yes stop_codon:yes gene_type:complete